MSRSFNHRMLTHPDLKWNKIWRNINSNELCSKQRTLYYLLVNEKNNTQEQKFKQNYKSVKNPNCLFCGITETLEHKFKICRQIEGYWEMLKEITESYHIKPLEFNELSKPELKGINKQSGEKIMSLFINYVELIDNNKIKQITDKNTLKVMISQGIVYKKVYGFVLF